MAGDPFLSDPKSRKKRSRNNRATSTTSRNTKKSKRAEEPSNDVGDEEISGISDSEDEQGNVSYDEDKEDEEDEDGVDSEEEFAQESAADKRRRLAKQYLENLKQETDYNFDAQDLDNDIIAKRLREDVAETKGQVYRYIADNLLLSDMKPTITRVGSKALTSLAVRFPYAYTVSKDMELIKWDIRDFKKKPQRIRHSRGSKKFTEISNESKNNGHSDEILTVAVSPDGKYVVTGGRDKRLLVWSAESLAPLRVLETRDRRGEILGLVFRRGSDQLYASCADLKVRTYSINQLAQLEILYGHQDHVVDIAALGQERCVTVGSRDRTAMLWKIADETRLTFRGGESEKKKKKRKDADDEMEIDEEAFFAEGSIDCVTMLDDSHFVTGSDNGSISLWSLAKKKPLFIQHLAHGLVPETSSTKASAESNDQKRELQVPEAQPYWITAIHAIPYSNLFISGSWNGSLKLWKFEDNLRSFTLLGELPNARGVVTRIDVAESGAKNQESFRIFATLSKEHRLGRWIEAGPGARNSIYSVVIDQQILKK